MSTININGKPVELDGEGYLTDFNSWSKEAATILAGNDNLDLTDDHWVVIELLRNHYQEHESIATARDLSGKMADHLGDERGNNSYLIKLFPGEHLKQAGKIAGLPRMAGCT